MTRADLEAVLAELKELNRSSGGKEDTFQAIDRVTSSALETILAKLLEPNLRSPEDTLNTPQAAAYLRLAVSTLNKLRCVGTGPDFFRMGRAVRYKRSDLDAFRDSRRATSTTDADRRLPRRLGDQLNLGPRHPKLEKPR